MAALDPTRNSSPLREVEKGPLFEVYQGPTCTHRLDWTRAGVFRSMVVGVPTVENAEAIIRRGDAMFRAYKRITILHDLWDMTNYDSAFRVELTKWGQNNMGAVEAIHCVTRSKLVNMGISVANLAMGGNLFTAYGKRAEFDAVCKRLGLPLNPSMPSLPPPSGH